MAVDVWVQAALFPKYNTEFYAYEMDDFGNGDRYWEIFDADGDTMVSYVEPENFGDFLDFARSINYDVIVNTYDSWIALEEY